MQLYYNYKKVVELWIGALISRDFVTMVAKVLLVLYVDSVETVRSVTPNEDVLGEVTFSCDYTLCRSSFCRSASYK